MKKKLFLGMLVISTTLAFVACGSKNRDKEENNSGNKTENVQSNKKVADSALDLLQEVWDEYEDEEKFAVMGGDMENSVSDRPGKFSIEDTENLDYTLALPEKSVDMIDDCASLMHMMNANNFTCGVFHLKDSGNVNKLADDFEGEY